MRITVTPNRWPQAGDLVGEYITATQAESGGGDLPPALAAECANPQGRVLGYQDIEPYVDTVCPGRATPGATGP